MFRGRSDSRHVLFPAGSVCEASIVCHLTETLPILDTFFDRELGRFRHRWIQHQTPPRVVVKSLPYQFLSITKGGTVSATYDDYIKLFVLSRIKLTFINDRCSMNYCVFGWYFCKRECMMHTTKLGCFKKDESGLWHYRCGSACTVTEAADDALSGRPKGVAWFWFTGTPCPIFQSDSDPKTLSDRWEDWQKSFENGEVRVLQRLRNLLPGA